MVGNYVYHIFTSIRLTVLLMCGKFQSATGAGGSLSSSSNKSRSDKSSTVRYKSLNKSQQKSPEVQKRQTQTLSPPTQRRNDAEVLKLLRRLKINSSNILLNSDLL